jgi:nitrogen-specific signal transduction histidine kinase
LIFAKQTRKWDSSRTNIVILCIVGAVAILLSWYVRIDTHTTAGTVLVSTLVRPEHKNGGSEDEVIVSVKDTGNGIDPEIFPKLFTKFVTKSQSGTGLGLFISKSIIEAHGGRIWAENTTNTNGKKGAIFSFSLPLRNDMDNDDKVDSNKHMNDSNNNSGNGFS